MKKIISLSILTIIFPIFTYAEEYIAPITNDGYAYASMFAGNFSILLSIIIGIMATFLVFRVARKMGGGLFGSVLNYIAFGMVLVVLGTVANVANNWMSDFWFSFDVLSTVFFALGYIFTVIGANKLFRGIMSN